MRFRLQAEIGAIKIRIYYPNAGSYAVKANNQDKDYTPWDQKTGRAGELTRAAGCGENRYVGVENFLEFFITTNCEIKIVPKDSIMCSVRLDWTLDEFYADGGVTSFTDRLAGVLGIDASRIKTVAVYQGSVIVEFAVEAADDEENKEAYFNKVQLNFIEAVVSNSRKLGAPIIDAMTDNIVVKPNFDPERAEKGKDGNIWDYLTDEENQKPGSADTQTETETESSTDTETNTDNEEISTDPTETITQKVVIVTKTVTEPALTDTVKYLVVFLAVLSVALVFVVGYIAMRMCSRKDVKPKYLKA